MKAKEFIIENKASDAAKPRNFVAKNAPKAGAGAHKDKKRAEKQGDVKHKKQAVPMEGVAEEKAGWSIKTDKPSQPTKKGPAPSWRLNPDGTTTDMNSGVTYNRDGSKKPGVAEVSKATLDRYVAKAVDAHGDADFSARMSKHDPDKRSYHVDQKKTAEKRRQGISRALDRMSKEDVVSEKAVSKQQQKFMGMVHAANKGETPASPEVAKVAAGMSKKAAKDFAATKHKGLPKKKGVSESYDSEELANEVYAEFERMYPNLTRRADERMVHTAIMDVLNYGGDSDPAALAQDVARAVKRNIKGVAEGKKPEHNLGVGWMLAKDKELGKKVAQNTDKARREKEMMQKYAGKKDVEEAKRPDRAMPTTDLRVGDRVIADTSKENYPGGHKQRVGIVTRVGQKGVHIRTDDNDEPEWHPYKIVKKVSVDEARQSAAVKLAKAWDRQQAKSAASRERAKELLNPAKKEQEKKNG